MTERNVTPGKVRTVRFVRAGCVLMLGLVLGFAAGLAAMASLAAVRDARTGRIPPEMSLECPDEIPLLAEAELELRISNPHSKPVVMTGVAVTGDLVRGLQFLSVSPDSEDSALWPDGRTWDMPNTLAPADEITVRFVVRGVSPGTLTGEVQVWLRDVVRVAETVSIRVIEAPGA